MGKSLYIKRMAELLQKQTGVRAVTVTIPIHGPVVTPDTVIEFLKNHMNTFNCIFHFDIAPGVSLHSYSKWYIIACYFRLQCIFTCRFYEMWTPYCSVC